MKTYLIKLSLSSYEKDLIELQAELKKYAGRIVKDDQIVSRQTKLIDLHIGAVNSYRIGYIPLCIHYHAEANGYVTQQFTELRVTLDNDKIVCDGDGRRYEYNFL
jgi:hypothetical protein